MSGAGFPNAEQLSGILATLLEELIDINESMNEGCVDTKTSYT